MSAAATAFGLSGSACASEQVESSVYCVDSNRQVVDDDLCEGDDDRYYLWYRDGRHRYTIGALVVGGLLVNAADRRARAANGLPESGKVTSGTVMRGGFGDDDGNRSGSSGG